MGGSPAGRLLKYAAALNTSPSELRAALSSVRERMDADNEMTDQTRRALRALETILARYASWPLRGRAIAALASELGVAAEGSRVSEAVQKRYAEAIARDQAEAAARVAAQRAEDERRRQAAAQSPRYYIFEGRMYYPGQEAQLLPPWPRARRPVNRSRRTTLEVRPNRVPLRPAARQTLIGGIWWRADAGVPALSRLRPVQWLRGHRAQGRNGRSIRSDGREEVQFRDVSHLRRQWEVPTVRRKGADATNLVERRPGGRTKTDSQGSVPVIVIPPDPHERHPHQHPPPILTKTGALACESSSRCTPYAPSGEPGQDHHLGGGSGPCCRKSP